MVGVEGHGCKCPACSLQPWSCWELECQPTALSPLEKSHKSMPGGSIRATTNPQLTHRWLEEEACWIHLQARPSLYYRRTGEIVYFIALYYLQSSLWMQKITLEFPISQASCLRDEGILWSTTFLAPLPPSLRRAVWEDWAALSWCPSLLLGAACLGYTPSPHSTLQAHWGRLCLSWGHPTFSSSARAGGRSA